MNLRSHLDKNNLHHAYLIEGRREEVLPEILKFVESLGVDTNANPDFTHLSLDSFKIEDARNLKSYSLEKGFSANKKIFVISANSFLLESQNSLLKMFEEPIENTHFFLVVPDANALLKTLVSRFYLIKDKSMIGVGDAEKFIKMPLKSRIDFIKELLAESEEEDVPTEVGIPTGVGEDGSRAKALKFLNALEMVLHNILVKNFAGGRFHPESGGIPKNSLRECCGHIFKVREFLRMPGSSTKTLMESVALVIPEKI